MIEQRIVDDLATLGLPVFQQGDWTGGELPEEFVTYFPADSVDVAHYDGLPAYTDDLMQVNAYAVDPDSVATLRKAVSDALLAKGWTRDGRGYAGELDEKTGRAAWHMTFHYFSKE